MRKLQTSYDKVDWDDLENEVRRKLSYLRAAWRASEQDCAPELHAKMVEDLYVPTISLLASFCACVEEKDEVRQ